MSEEKRITTVSDYRDLIGEIKTIKLPSGAIFRIRRLSVMDYIKEGLEDIPNEFFVFIAEVSTGKIGKADPNEVKKNYELFEKFLKITVEKGVIEPPMILRYDKEKQDTHLVFAELKLEDQKYLIDYITGKA